MKKKLQETKVNEMISVVYTGEEWIPISHCEFLEFVDSSDNKIVKFQYKDKQYRSVIRTILS